MEYLLRTQDLSRHFGGVAAVNLVNLEIADRRVHAVIGPNGAGKTTLINVITGLLPASGGGVLYREKDITRLPAHERVRLGLCRTFQITSIFSGLSVYENVRIARQIKEGGTTRIFSSRQSLGSVNRNTEAIIERVGLSDVADSPAKNLAHGDQRVLEVGIALAGEPSVLFLDEPAAGMSPTETKQISELIRSLASEMVVVLVEHDMEVVMSICDRVTVLHHGRVIAEDTPQAISENEEVKNAYLGDEKWIPVFEE